MVLDASTVCSRCPGPSPSPLLLAGFWEAGLPHKPPNSPLPGTGATKTGNFFGLALGVTAAEIVEWGKFLIPLHSQLECLTTTSLGGPHPSESVSLSLPHGFSQVQIQNLGAPQQVVSVGRSECQRPVPWKGTGCGGERVKHWPPAPGSEHLPLDLSRLQ